MKRVQSRYSKFPYQCNKLFPRTRLRIFVACLLLLSLVFRVNLKLKKHVVHLSEFNRKHPQHDPQDVVDFAYRLITLCPSAYYDINSQKNRSVDFQEIPNTVASVLHFVSRVFILTSEKACRLEGISATCVRGKVLDSCVPSELEPLISGHGYAVSLSHAAIIALSLRTGLDSVAIIEEDAMLEEMEINTSLSLQHLLHEGNWKLVRLSFRPYFFEIKSSGTSYACPDQCVCRNRPGDDKGLCHISSAGCDLRSADFYLVNHFLFEELILRLLDVSETARVIDYSVLQSFNDYWVASPQISYQNKLESVYPATLQKGFGELFKELCVEQIQ
jgi:hypothetical protein